MSYIAAGTAAVSLVPSLFKFFSGSSQKKQANAIKPVNPGYQLNNQVIDNARILGDRYTNYQLPGQSQIQNGINNNFQTAYTQGAQGASSGGDLADLAAKLAYGKNIANNNLAVENAQGKDAALGSYIDANAAAGREYQGKNAYDRSQYDNALRQKAALTQAGNTNQYNAIDNASAVGSTFLTNVLSKKSTNTDLGSTSKAKPLGSVLAGSQPDTTQASQYSTTPSPYFNQDDGRIDFSKLYQNRYQ